MERRHFVSGVASCAAFASIGILIRTAYAQSLTPVRVMMAEGDDATPTLYAAQNGIFKKYGLDVHVTAAPSGAAALASLAGNAADISGTSMLPFLSAHQRGIPLTIIAPLAVSTPDAPYAALLVKKDSTIKTGKDFAGKTIASPALRDLNWVATMAWIDRNGGNSADVQSIEVPASAIPEALNQGRIAGATVTTPRYVQAEKAGLVRSVGNSYTAIAERFLFAAIVANTAFADANKDVITNYGRAIRDAARYANAHHAETLPIYAAFAKIDVKEIGDAPRAVSAPYIEPKDLVPVIDIAVKYKILPAAIDPATLISPAALKTGA